MQFSIAHFRSSRLLQPLALLIICSAACGALLVFRIGWTFERTYWFLAWNLFLAWVPLLVALAMRQNRLRQSPFTQYKLLFGVWLLFLPNAPYIITDFLHLRPKSGIPLWFDAVLLFSFALTGLQLGVISLYLVHNQVRELLGRVGASVVMGACVVLSGYGVYLGRFQRWNSWDLFTNPYALLTDCIYQLTNWTAIKVTIVFAFVLTFFYLLFLSLIRWNAHERTNGD